MSRMLIAAAALGASTASYSATIKEWECRDFISPADVLVTATVNDGRTSGSISVAGVTHMTAYRVAGFDRRWDFGEAEDGSYTYASIVSPDGKGTYYDFSGSDTAKPSMIMKFRQRPLPKERK